MKLKDVMQLDEASVDDKLRKDPNLPKRVALHFRHDTTVPANIKFGLGPTPSVDQVMEAWLNFLDKVNVSQTYGIISPEKQYHDWATKVYASGATDWEDIGSHFAESIKSLQILSRRDLIPAAARDINRYPSMQSLNSYVAKFQAQLRTAKDEERLKGIYDSAKSVTIVDNDRYTVIVPLNMGAAIKFGRSVGVMAQWCTAAADLNRNLWANYAPRGFMFIFFDKENQENKYQASAGSNQFMNYKNNYHDQPQFARDYPCAMEEILKGMVQHKAELEGTDNDTGYKGTVEDNNDVIRQRFANAFGDCDDTMYDEIERHGDADYEAGPE